MLSDFRTNDTVRMFCTIDLLMVLLHHWINSARIPSALAEDCENHYQNGLNWSNLDLLVFTLTQSSILVGGDGAVDKSHAFGVRFRFESTFELRARHLTPSCSRGVRPLTSRVS